MHDDKLILNHCFSIPVIIVGTVIAIIVVIGLLILLIVTLVLVARHRHGHVKTEAIEMEPEGMVNL